MLVSSRTPGRLTAVGAAVVLLLMACSDDPSSMSGADTTPPTVVSVMPANGAANVPTTTTIALVFSESIDLGTSPSETVFLTPNPGFPQSHTTSGANVTVETPTLAAGTGYTVTVTTAVRDLAGNPLATTFTSSFTTASAGAAGRDVRPGE